MEYKTESKTNSQLDNQFVRLAEELELTMNTKGWKEIVQPLIDKTIRDTIGYKRENGQWDSGNYVNFVGNDKEIVNMFIYRQALIEFNNRLLSYFESAQDAKKRLDYTRKKNEIIMPMEDTKYSDSPESKVRTPNSYDGGTVEHE